MAQSTTPPQISMRLPQLSPKRRPSSMPTTVSTPATRPITTAGFQTLTPSMARVSPTAKASMLVATESITMVSPRVGSVAPLSSSSSKASLIM